MLMIETVLLHFALLLLPLINWPVAIILMRASARSPKILSLRERAGFALMIAISTTIYVGLTINVELGFPLFDTITGRTIVRLGVLTIGLYPMWWLWSYYTNRFGR